MRIQPQNVAAHSEEVIKAELKMHGVHEPRSTLKFHIDALLKHNMEYHGWNEKIVNEVKDSLPAYKKVFSNLTKTSVV